jgi:hypothetical protein
MAGSDSDVEFEDEWEEVPGPQAPDAAAAADTGDILVMFHSGVGGVLLSPLGTYSS